MGAYFWASLAVLAAFAVALWWWDGPTGAEARVVLPASASWTGVTLERGLATFELTPGAAATVPAGRYRVTLVGADGRAAVDERDLRPGDTLVLDDGG